MAATCGQVDGTKLASFEVLLRKTQTIAHAHGEKVRAGHFGGNGGGKAGGSSSGGDSLTDEEQEALVGRTQHGVSMVSPALLSHVKDGVVRQPERMKSLPKAREY